MTCPEFDPELFISSRRQAVEILAAGLSLFALGGCRDTTSWNNFDIAGLSPALQFAMSRAPDGREATQADFRGDIVMLYLGYTFCPDVCPTTLANVADIFKRLGPEGRRARFLFVTVDPARDTLPVLADYLSNFGPQFLGLRGTPDQLLALARRYRLVYSVTPATGDHPYEVTHSSAIYVFDGAGAARLLVPSLASARPDIAGTAADLKRLIAETPSRGLIARFFDRV